MDGVFPDSIPLALRVVVWVVVGWLGLRLGCFTGSTVAASRPSIVTGATIAATKPRPRWMKKHVR